MSDSPNLTKFQQKLAERRAREEAQAPKAEPPPEFEADLVPDQPFERSNADVEMDNIVDRIDIVDAYIRWCGKMRPEVKGKTEGIMISCPIPGHQDKNPSAWLNTEKQTWFCGGCQQGGDVHDLAAFHFNYPVPGYKEGELFHKLRREMAEDYGYRFETMPGNVTVITEPVADPVIPEPPVPEVRTEYTEPEAAPVIDLFDDDDLNVTMPTLDWRPIVPENTFLDTYMRCTTRDDVPEEYHFWNGLIALGFALGRDVRLADLVPVYGNLFVCTLGRSGTGKSKARYHLDTLLNRALPHDNDDPNSKGVRRINTPGSAEVLINQFMKPITDPSNPKVILGYAPVRGIIDFSELSSLVGRSGRQGSVMTPTLMQFYDMEDIITTASMTHGSKIAERPFASALTTTQPKALRGLIGKQDDSSGFLNRWVFASGGEKQKYAIGGVAVDITPAIEPLQEIQGWAASFAGIEMVQWSTEAAERFTQFFYQQIEQDKKKSDNDLITRVDLLMKKLILLFTANRKLREVPLESVEEAIKCYDYIIASYGIPAAQIGNTLQNEVSEAVLHQARVQLKRDGRGVSVSQVAKSLKHRKYPNDLIVKTIDVLVKLDLLVPETNKTGTRGRPTVRYKYNGD